MLFFLFVLNFWDVVFRIFHFRGSRNATYTVSVAQGLRCFFQFGGNNGNSWVMPGTTASSRLGKELKIANVSSTMRVGTFSPGDLRPRPSGECLNLSHKAWKLKKCREELCKSMYLSSWQKAWAKLVINQDLPSLVVKGSNEHWVHTLMTVSLIPSAFMDLVSQLEWWRSVKFGMDTGKANL